MPTVGRPTAGGGAPSVRRSRISPTERSSPAPPGPPCYQRRHRAGPANPSLPPHVVVAYFGVVTHHGKGCQPDLPGISLRAAVDTTTRGSLLSESGIRGGRLPARAPRADQLRGACLYRADRSRLVHRGAGVSGRRPPPPADLRRAGQANENPSGWNPCAWSLRALVERRDHERIGGTDGRLLRPLLGPRG